MQSQNRLEVLLDALLPKPIEYMSRFTEPRERLIIIELVQVGSIEIFSKNTSSPVTPVWSEPRVKVSIWKSLDGMSLEQIKQLNELVFAAQKIVAYWMSLSEVELSR